MKFKIQRDSFLTILAKAQNVAEAKKNMAVLGCVLLDAVEKKLNIYATDLEVSITDSSNAEVTVPGRLAVVAKNIFDIVRELMPGWIEVASMENNWLEIRQGKYLSKIVGVAPEEYPMFPQVETESLLKIDSKILGEMIDKTVYSVSPDSTRHYLTGVYFERKTAESFQMVSTDGHRLSIIQRKLPMEQMAPGLLFLKKGSTK
jgi:DNA polymerase III subunit beta